MLKVHCICHWLALAYADAADDLQFLQDFETTMIQLWVIFKNLCKQLKTYIKTTMKIKEFENLPKDKEKTMVKSVKRAFRTRWLSLEAAVDGFFKESSHLVHAPWELQLDPKSEVLPKVYSKRTTSSFYQLHTYLSSCCLIWQHSPKFFKLQN